MTLVLVMIAAALLAGLARRSAAEAVEAREAVEQLQRRWVTISARSTLLPRVEPALRAAEGRAAIGGAPPKDAEPVSMVRVTCTLAGRDYDLLLTDEQAKLNVNALVRQEGRADAEAALGRWLRETRPTGARSVELRLRPRVDESTGGIGAFGQVFVDASPATLIGKAIGRGPAARLTCWGNGKLNVRRADAEAIRLLCNRPLGRRFVEGLIAARERSPFESLNGLIARADVTDNRLPAKARALLTDQSQSHGLWIVSRGRTGDRHAWLVGLSAPEQGIVRTLAFEW